jgi:hypothetical protein
MITFVEAPSTNLADTHASGLDDRSSASGDKVAAAGEPFSVGPPLHYETAT